ncbi:DUF6470 family protein [Ferdinandcohnia quinoae]|uniref:DUF6470 family protein n=1 Tax=Fredinandcohnia quinoae TaxID=2918902 RepID=A0AAW5E515_9BACI|nr:DUF6470 family protein [Fredinandcohnia sp. SECRCQ15]MCH1625071.1 DUF6470 family protein [Fredinandcohnia sp. SECRCQ15]
MQLPQIRLESQNAKLNLNIQKPVQEISQQSADLTIEQPPATMTIQRTPGRLTIDQTLAWENLDLKSPMRRAEENASYGMSVAFETVGRIAEEGNELMKIENGGNPIIDQVIRNSETETTFDTGSTPSQFSVRVNYEPVNLTIDWDLKKPIINVDINKPIHNYTPGKVTGYVSPGQSLSIDFIGVNVDKIK